MKTCVNIPLEVGALLGLFRPSSGQPYKHQCSQKECLVFYFFPNVNLALMSMAFTERPA